MRLPRWKKVQKQRKEQKKLSVIRYTLLVIFFIFLAGISWRAYGSLRKSLWDGNSRLTVALNSNPILVASFEPSEKTLNVLSIPGNTYIETIHGYGFYQAEKIWKLGELEGYNGEFLAGSLQQFLGLPVDGYGSVSGVKCQVSSVRCQVSEEKIKSSFLTIIESLLKGEGETNLTRWDLIRLWWGVKKVRSDKANLVDLSEISAVSKIVLPDGTPALEPDPLLLEQLISDLFSDQKIKRDGFSIGIYNSTDYSGLAKKAARIIDNIGGQVIEVGDWKESIKECQVMSDESNSKKYTVKKLMKVFGCQYGGEMGESRVEIGLILGEDYHQHLIGK